MKKLNYSRNFWVRQRHNERGQTAIIVVLALGLFLLAFTGLAVDYSNLWFHRQAAQGAADAACQAGAMDMYALSQGNVSGTPAQFVPGFIPGTGNDCSSASGATPCKYAALNGYNGTGLVASTESNDVAFSFPASITGVTAPPVALTSVPFMSVTVTDRVKVYLAGLLTGASTQDVGATAQCGLVLAQAPIPLVILHPTMSGALHFNGSGASITIYGGPTQSIEVNSSSATAISGGGTIDLSQGGPNDTGSTLGTFGGPPTPTGTFTPVTTPSSWISPSPFVPDPYAQVAAPAQPPLAPAPTPVLYGINGCPDNNNGCLEYAPGYYPAQIKIKNTATGGGKTAIFDAGIYWLGAGIAFDSNSMARPSLIDNTPNQMGGTLFYLSGTASLSVDSNAGSKPTTDTYASSGAICPLAPAGTTVPGNVPANLAGIVLLAPCQGPYGDPLGQSRGILFFQDRAAAATANWNGGGQVLMSGSMYFHQCEPGGSGTGCLPADYGTVLDLGGTSGSGTYLLGEVITDQMLLHGTPAFAMDLSPASTYNILKVALLQ